MAKLADHQSSATTKLLFIGDSGSGKTGALASLAQAGFKLRIIDLDNGIDVLANLLRSGNYGPNALANVEYETLTDKMRKAGDKLIPATASVWQRVAKLLDNWGPQALEEARRRDREIGRDGKDTKIDEATLNLKGISSWGTDDILVIDSLTMLSDAALKFVLSMNARLGQQPHQSDWYQGQQLIESLLQMLYDESVRCNVIVISHITFIGEEGGPQHGYPNTLGKALPPKVGRYFNTTLMARTSGQGTNRRHKIFTTTVGSVELKNTAPTKVKGEYPLETGLADYFKDVRG